MASSADMPPAASARVRVRPLAWTWPAVKWTSAELEPSFWATSSLSFWQAA